MEQNTNNNKPKNSIFDRKIGALWVKKDKTGQSYLSGDVTIKGETRSILIMKNSRKVAEKYPDYEIFLSLSEIAQDILDEKPKAAPKNDEDVSL